jgi:ribosomal protein L11 methyltransferase
MWMADSLGVLLSKPTILSPSSNQFTEQGMDYTEITCHVFPPRFSEIVIAEFAEYGFESFAENADGFQGYIPVKTFSEETFLKLGVFQNKEIRINFTIKTIPDENWNAVWESNFEPVSVGSECYIRAPFHPEKKDVRYEIIIEPKMSFGTGHHETTHLMVQLLLQLDVKGKTVLDMGCGTGILAILARKMQAAKVVAIDNDEWAYNNTKENIIKNNVPEIDVIMGDVSSLLPEMQFDLIIANINRNILLNDIPSYAKVLKNKGILTMSGFYLDDLEIINRIAQKHGLQFIRNLSLNNWCASLYQKE